VHPSTWVRMQIDLLKNTKNLKFTFVWKVKKTSLHPACTYEVLVCDVSKVFSVGRFAMPSLCLDLNFNPYTGTLKFTVFTIC
jgi:hypothetical protein